MHTDDGTGDLIRTARDFESPRPGHHACLAAAAKKTGPKRPLCGEVTRPVESTYDSFQRTTANEDAAEIIIDIMWGLKKPPENI